ncbi:peroxide stress protein YaaA [Mycetocola tolaasinivorans]|uniref:Peroxide stress protein YaaA n=1 Tax=Mycetocola tolaasinivorans TaxID=76635 RepID=A0A3L7A3N6_9MICO|nr:peroxide stress protein YaaA [Mycetocola tolaasinivorans]RLP74817.1 peroxide stress protein YaaA [Mycetocola tolaasinivorans]
MFILLPPSETKRQDEPGAVSFNDDLYSGLRFPELSAVRQELVADLELLCADPVVAASALKLGARLAGEVALNTALETAPRLPALERYTGVLFDPISAETLTVAERKWAAQHVLIQSAPFGPVGAMDPLPNYRLSATGKVPPITLKKRWAIPGAEALTTLHGFILDLRSEAYSALSPLPVGKNNAYLRVVAAPAPGQSEPGNALNHFNKKTKGLLVSALLADRPGCRNAAQFVEWATARGFTASLADHQIRFEELR